VDCIGIWRLAGWRLAFFRPADLGLSISA